jgi:hypothetical protein
MGLAIPIETSARHIHISQADFEVLFGEGKSPTYRADLSQPGQYVCHERITVKGPKGTFENVTSIEETIEGLSEYRKIKVGLKLEYDTALEGQDYKCQITEFFVAGMKLLYYNQFNGQSSAYNYATMLAECEILERISRNNNGNIDNNVYRKSVYIGQNQPIVTNHIWDESALKNTTHATVNNGYIFECIDLMDFNDIVKLKATEEMYKISIGIYGTK